MSTKVVIFAVFGTAAVAAAAAGGYAALRMNAADSTAVSSARTDAASVPDPAAPADPTPAPDLRESPRASAPADAHAEHPAARPAAGGSSLVSGRSLAGTAVPESSPAAPPAPAPISSPLVDPAPESKEPAPASSPEPPKAVFEELVVSPDSVIGIRLDAAVSTETARVEDKVTARIARDVTVGGHTAIPAGAKLDGVVTVVERGGKFKDRARLGIRFLSLVLADGTRLPIQTETIFRDGEPPAAPAASKVGASAVVGGILGGILGGKKGAILGTTAGAAGGAAAVMASGSNDAVLQAGTALTVRLTSAVAVTIQKDQVLGF